MEIENWRVLRSMFPSEWEHLGRSSGTIKRLRGFSSAEALFRTLLMHGGLGADKKRTK
jgi:hypothetical protein